MLDEPYINEHPGESSGEVSGGTPIWGSTGSGGSGGGGGGGGGGGSWVDPSWEAPSPEKENGLVWTGLMNARLLRKKKNTLMRQKGFLLLGTLPCSLAPPLLVTGLAEEHLSHYRCLCLRLNGELLHLKSTGPWHYHFLDVPLAEGTYTLTGKWQSGHYDYSEVSQVRIFLFGVDLGFVKLPLLKYTTVAVITKTATELTVNNFKGSYRGNDKFVENNQ